VYRASTHTAATKQELPVGKAEVCHTITQNIPVGLIHDPAIQTHHQRNEPDSADLMLIRSTTTFYFVLETTNKRCCLRSQEDYGVLHPYNPHISTSTMTATTNPTCDIPSINLQPFFEDKGVVIGEAPTEDQRKVARTIHEACQEHGFLYVTNFGFTKELGDSLFAASEEVFANPNKLEDYAPWGPAHNTGYSPYRNESLNANRPPDLKEAFNVRFPPTYENPSLARCPPSLQKIVYEQDLFGLLKTVAIRFGMACAVALDLPVDTFTKTLNIFNMCTVRFLHFPPCELGDNGTIATSTDARSNSVPVRVGEHTDFGAYTVRLLMKNANGLDDPLCLLGDGGVLMHFDVTMCPRCSFYFSRPPREPVGCK
jgi:non-haem dioxygenase in morphine synthesis N-terminal